MKILTKPFKQLLSIVIICSIGSFFNAAIAKSDMQIMADVQKARAKLRKKIDHVIHLKPLDPSDEFRGVYYGYLPCDHCAGIKMTLSLKNRKNYLMVIQYAQASNKEFYEKGKYDWNEKTRIVTLNPKKGKSLHQFLIKNEATLIKLGQDGKRMKGNQDKYSLVRSDKNKAREVHIH